MVLVLLSVSILLLAVGTTLTRAECPSPSELDIMYNSTHFIAAYYYNGDQSQTAIMSCNGNLFRVYEGYEQNAPAGEHLLAHALVVRRRCKIYHFEDYDYKGTVTEYPPGVYPYIPEGYKSYKVRCNLKHINCQPTDGYSTVMVCDASNSNADMECHFRMSVGIKFSAYLSMGFLEEEREELDMGLILKELFKQRLGVSATTGIDFEEFEEGVEKRLGVSATTGIDWTEEFEESVEKSQAVHVAVKAPAGRVLKVEQAIGYCGGHQIRTRIYKTSFTPR